MSSPLPTELPRPIDVLGLPIRPLTTVGLIDALLHRAAAGVRTTVCYANAHTVNLAFADPRFRDTLAGCDLLYADGASVVWASRWSDKRLPERMTAADYFQCFAEGCAERGLSLYVLGGRDGIADRAAQRLRRDVPGLKIAGARSGHFDWADSNEIIDAINSARPDVLAVGMSSPRQERWLAEHGAKLSPPVRWCVGALFDYLAGQERRSPAWLCRIGCEWMFRLAVDPVGKWRRYLLGNPRFVWNALSWRITGSKRAAPLEALPVTKA